MLISIAGRIVLFLKATEHIFFMRLCFTVYICMIETSSIINIAHVQGFQYRAYTLLAKSRAVVMATETFMYRLNCRASDLLNSKYVSRWCLGVNGGVLSNQKISRVPLMITNQPHSPLKESSVPCLFTANGHLCGSAVICVLLLTYSLCAV